ncbi:phosphotransferase family protein [Corallococcus exiguus]|uniref:phosphotransferase family protein n=1 Tax=Corallococcus exiguus TaxID=83462 RepID=UPI003DA574D3
MTMREEHRHALESFLATKAEAREVRLVDARLLSGGAIQENWLLTAVVSGGPHEGVLECVLRSDAASGVSVSHDRVREFALLREAFRAGVTVPEPLWLGDGSVLGRAFFVMRKARGTAAGHRIVKDLGLGGDREALTERLGAELARLHAIRPPVEALSFLPVPALSPALRGVNEFQSFLDGHHAAFPALEWGIRWLERHAPRTPELVLTHRDFRTGNYMLDEAGLTAVLDWEFAAWSDPLEDLGWFCARCWRFGQFDQEAGGIGSREALARGYARVSGRTLDWEAVRYWEVFAHARWAVIALQQGERHVSGREPSLELALTAHVVPELELELLSMTGGRNA